MTLKDQESSPLDPNNLEEPPRSKSMVAGLVGLVAFLTIGMQAPLLALFIVDLGATVGILGLILSSLLNKT